ncbi:MAG: hypothetical protein J7J98_00105 [candidate division Zixibacteria bacterium]|nr:hypothetical protein [candidate division Zixibacteria bacterium]
MPQKIATYIGFGDDNQCTEIRKFIEDAGIRLNFRDMAKDPLSVRELDLLLGHNPLTYFVNPTAKEYKKQGFDKQQPERQEMLEIIADNPGLLKYPIIKTARLLTVGCNKEKISEMFQIDRNGNQNNEISGNRGGKINRRSLSKR